MALPVLLDLKGVVSPLDLLKCKSFLNSLKEGDQLEVLVEDEDVAKNLITIIQRSDDELLFKKQTPEAIWIGIRKGAGNRKQKEQAGLKE